MLPPEPSSRPIPPPDSSVLSPGALLQPEITGPISTRKTLPVRPHKESQDNSIEELLEINRSQAIEVRPKTNPLPPQQPRLPMGIRKLPATLDEFLLLLGPRRPPPRPIVLDAREDEDNVPKDAMARFFNVHI